MNKTKVNAVILGLIALLIAGLSSVATYVVDDHFDYVKKLEDKVTSCDGDNVELNQEVLDLKSSLVVPPSK